jgi:hypothetical protein
MDANMAAANVIACLVNIVRFWFLVIYYFLGNECVWRTAL